MLLPAKIWILDTRIETGTLERLGDARRLADSTDDRVGVLIVGDGTDNAERLFQHGADMVCLARVAEPQPNGAGQNSVVAAAVQRLVPDAPRLVFVADEGEGRAIACRLAARTGWRLVAPALVVRRVSNGYLVTALDATGKWARQEAFGEETAVVTFRTGVAEALPPDARRTGNVEVVDVAVVDEGVVERRVLPIDPGTADIRHLERLVAGGRGLGGAEGFDRLRRIAQKLGAGVAASRMAVDLGWIGQDRQVGQTGKTVRPDLYLACGISGASHHLEGMSESGHIVAINNDPQAPIHRKAHLGLVADLHEVLHHLESELKGDPP